MATLNKKTADTLPAVTQIIDVLQILLALNLSDLFNQLLFLFTSGSSRGHLIVNGGNIQFACILCSASAFNPGCQFGILCVLACVLLASNLGHTQVTVIRGHLSEPHLGSYCPPAQHFVLLLTIAERPALASRTSTAAVVVELRFGESQARSVCGIP